MTDDGQKYKGPALRLEIGSLEGDAYRWSITMEVANHDATKMLGYQASGIHKKTSGKTDPFEIMVRDDNREVWTSMPEAHRSDIRRIFEELLEESFYKIKYAKKLIIDSK